MVEILGEGVEMLMATLYLTEQYSLVKLEGEALRVQAAGGKNGTVIRVPLNKIEQVIVLGDITLTTPALHALLERRIGIHYMSARGKSHGALLADWGKNSGVRLAQYALCRDVERSFEVARQCVAGKLLNMRTLLLRYARGRETSENLQDAAQTIKRCLRELARLKPPEITSDRMHGLGPLLGLEGSGSAAYYSVFEAILKGEWRFPGRVKRPPTDPVNALLSFGYTVLTNQVVSLIHSVGLDPGLGVLHQPGFGKPALALDLVETFRPIIIDSVVVTMLNTGQITPGDFANELGAYRLSDSARRSYIEKIEARLSEQIQHPQFGYKVSYRRCIELQARIFAKHAQGEIANYVPFTVR
ncbi:CRISPR-associated endonuclease Cas1 [Candidatus Chloroploca sp. Khr17]|uniref:CRISPR-associated endonuclease Cas1 n=1 Tax=Candidatus Chloroploca sp. Khr17 TaxID=2496869 RepID=UPI00101D30B5|nr:CRISPR-associated endonuclease Cas1 [Candidatus Chloroploca sp. Khr17]